MSGPFDLPYFIDSRLVNLISKCTPLKIKAIIIGPVVLVDGYASPSTRRHETIHWRQQLELLIVGFYFLYALSWLWLLVKHRSWREAYLAIPFEVEARTHQYNVFYLHERRAYAWLRKDQQ